LGRKVKGKRRLAFPADRLISNPLERDFVARDFVASLALLAG